MDDVLREFLAETVERLEVLDGELVRLEQDPNDPELLGNIFRLVHTIKGTCGFLGLPRLESVAHAGENVLGKFRDKRPFDQFGAIVLPRILKTRSASHTLRIWSAACSSGQEPYTIAMILRENAARLSGWRCEILATDLSRQILAKARAGIYSQFEVQRGLPISLLVKYFRQDGEKWHIDPALRAMVQFREFNLLDNPKALGAFDVVFCRNVLIYFDQVTKSRVLDRIREVMPDGGFLYLGGAETVLGITDRFQPISGERGIYGAAPSVASNLAIRAPALRARTG